ncbi:hypothetical protein CBS101457_003481 [Exobasidium rhododendri]|nr:hypothetical protein CBS101457_003481 [Exobasidium rhododendri]
MTTRSTRSAMSAKERMTDGDVYVYLLQVSVLSWTMQSKAAAREAALNVAAASSSSKKGISDVSSVSAGGATSSLSRTDWMSFGSLSDMIQSVSGSNKAVRFPEKLLKRLGERLEQIAMGRDHHYRDQSLRQTVGIFYGTFKEAGFQKQMKENRKIEELILFFVTTAQGGLRKRMENDSWKEELDKQVGTFVKIIRECLRTVHGVSKELTERLEGYSNKLAPNAIGLSEKQQQHSQQSQRQQTQTSTNGTTPNDSRRGSVASTSALGGTVKSGNPIAESSMIRCVAELFKVEADQMQKDIEFMKKTCSEQNAMIDLKHCVKNINLQAAWPGRKEDFRSEEGFTHWRTSELQSLSNMMMQMCKANPELLKTSSSDSVVSTAVASTVAPGEVPTAAAEDGQATETESLDDAIDPEEEATFGGFTFIPPDPKAYFKRALELCIDYDLEQIRYQPEEEEVSLSILSKSHVELLNECVLRWRIMTPYRVVCNLDVIKYKYDRGEVPLDCISESLSTTDRLMTESPIEGWTRSDHALLCNAYTSLFESFMRFVHEAFQDIHNVEAEEIQPYIALIQDLHGSGLVKRDGKVEGESVELHQYAEDLKDRIRIMAIHEYTAKTTDLFSQAIENEVIPLLDLLEWIEKNAKRIDKRYPEPIFGSIDPVSLLLEKQVRLYLDDLESMKHQIVVHATREKDSLPFEDIFLLYNRVRGLLRMQSAFCPDQQLSFSITEWFEPHIRHWLLTTERKTTEWVHNAVSQDTFVPIDSEGAVHSSSIDDLFGALQQPLDFILTLQWPDAYRNARFLTSMAKTVSRSIEQYCSMVEEMFMEEMFPRSAEGQDASQKQSAWMIKAKQTLQGEKKVEPFHFQATSCVKLNNIESARLLLDKLYTKIDADEQARIIKETVPDVPERKQKQRYIFTVKVVLGENLHPVKDTSNSRIDSFITLSDERGNKIAKTRTIYESTDPRWDEVFDIPVDNNIWLAATVWDRKLVGDHNLCGRAYLRLDPKYFSDFLSHELWLNLDTQGRVLLRVSMEGEKDDILFYFGRAFRSLKRAEGDMVRIIVDKMSIFIRQCLSRSVLKSLVKTSGINLDKALGNVKALYAQALASTNVNGSMIPPVEAEMPKKQRFQQLTDQEIEAAILPLLDYLDECLGTLKSSLSETESLLVLTKVWKEVLNTIDGILLPPLSESTSDMNQLSGREVEVVFKWLSMLRNYFNAFDEETGMAHGVPLEVLQGPKYREIVSYTLYHDASTDGLMEACVREMQQRLRRAPTQQAKNKSVLQQRSLGTIKKRKQEKKTEEQDDNLDVILRLLRMRSGTLDFLQQQFATMGSLQAMGNASHANASPNPAALNRNPRRPSLNHRISKALGQPTSPNRTSRQQQQQQLFYR